MLFHLRCDLTLNMVSIISGSCNLSMYLKSAYNDKKSLILNTGKERRKDMYSMKIKVFLVGAVILLALPVYLWAFDVAGTWIAQAPSQQGNVDIILKFNVDGEKLTGTLNNPIAEIVDIKDGKVKGDDVSFYVEREFGGNKIKIVWKGKASGDEIKFVRTVEMEGSSGGPGGGFPPTEIIAKRAK